MTLKALPAAIAAVSIITYGCTQQENTTDTTEAASSGNEELGTATVQASDGREIKESLVRYYAVNAFQKPLEQLTQDERETAIENLANLDVLAEEAEERGLPTERTIAVELEMQRQQLLASYLVERFRQENPPSDAELQAEYDSVVDQLGSVEHKARHILVETEEEARSIIEQVEAGADFAELANEHSLDSAPDGDLDWFRSSSVVEPFAEAVESLEAGSYTTEPVETQFGWHVILLEDRRTSDPPTLDAVRADLTNRINQRKVEAFIDSLR